MLNSTNWLSRSIVTKKYVSPAGSRLLLEHGGIKLAIGPGRGLTSGGYAAKRPTEKRSASRYKF
jgi:hypothetical protein